MVEIYGTTNSVLCDCLDCDLGDCSCVTGLVGQCLCDKCDCE